MANDQKGGTNAAPGASRRVFATSLVSLSDTERAAREAEIAKDIATANTHLSPEHIAANQPADDENTARGGTQRGTE